MSRKRRGTTGRGTANWGKLSGVTWATIPSGVTIDGNSGFNTKGNSIGFFNAGMTGWAGTSVLINHGFTSSLISFVGSYRYEGSMVSAPSVVHWEPGITAGTVTAALYSANPTGTLLALLSGGSIAWIASGT